MKSVKQLLFVFAALFCHLTANAYEFVSDGIYYTITSYDDHTVGVSFHPTKKYTGDVVIPEQVTYDGEIYSVTSITAGAFRQCAELTSISIPTSIVSIGDGAFDGCKGLTKLTIPTSVKTLGASCFARCSNLTSFVIPNSIIDIPSEAFAECSSVKTLTIPSSVSTIGYRAFFRLSSLEALKLPNSVTTIGEAAFYGCSKLTSFVVPNSVTYIGNAAFNGCTLSKVIIPNSVKEVKRRAFQSCGYLNNVVLGNSVQTVEDGVFYYCKSLSILTLPSSVKKVGDLSDGCYISKVICEAPEPPTLGSLRAGCTVYVPVASVDLYKEDAKWGEYNIQPITVNEKTNILYVQETEGVKGKQMTFSLRMKHNRTVSGFQANIVLPEGFTVDNVERGADLAAQYAFSNSAKSDGSHFVLCYSDSNTPMPAGDIEVAKLTVSVPESVAEGEYSVEIKDAELSYGTEYNIADAIGCKFIVRGQIPGDANGDGKVSVADISSIAAYLVSDVTEGLDLKAADANGDGRISVVDITTIAEQLFNDEAEARTLYVESVN